MPRFVHAIFELVLASTAFSGARRAAGVEINYQNIENETIRSTVGYAAGVGDWVVDKAAHQIRSFPGYFVPIGTQSTFPKTR
ncbi:hypothetical protein DFS34DRAFT_633002 [Phlyctochytrium arcticum]|nr:hypothetical protein DFS34DRAFT_633002 [Phlyctochytrium arcticum]